MSRRDIFAENAARIAARQQSGGDPVPEPEGPPGAAEDAPPPRARIDRVPKTLKLWPADNRALNRWLDDAAVELGEARVNAQEALEALVRLLLTDESTSRRLLAEMRRDRRERH